jgi:hypothetical protein
MGPRRYRATVNFSELIQAKIKARTAIGLEPSAEWGVLLLVFGVGCAQRIKISLRVTAICLEEQVKG